MSNSIETQQINADEIFEIVDQMAMFDPDIASTFHNMVKPKIPTRDRQGTRIGLLPPDLIEERTSDLLKLMTVVYTAGYLAAGGEIEEVNEDGEAEITTINNWRSGI